MRLLLVRRVALFAGVRSKVEVHVVLVSSQAVGEVKFLSTNVALVVALVEMRCDKVLGLVALLCKRLATLLARKLLDLEMHHARVLLHGRRVAERASALSAAVRLALPSLRGGLQLAAGRCGRRGERAVVRRRRRRLLALPMLFARV